MLLTTCARATEARRSCGLGTGAGTLSAIPTCAAGPAKALIAAQARRWASASRSTARFNVASALGPSLAGLPLPPGQSPCRYVCAPKTRGSFSVHQCSTWSPSAVATSAASLANSSGREGSSFHPPRSAAQVGREWWKSVSITRMPRARTMRSISAYRDSALAFCTPEHTQPGTSLDGPGEAAQRVRQRSVTLGAIGASRVQSTDMR